MTTFLQDQHRLPSTTNCETAHPATEDVKTTGHRPYQTHVITTRDDFEGLADEWNDLLDRSAACTVFLTWEWIQAWLETIRPEAKFLVIVVRDSNGQLAGIGPFYRTRVTLLRCLPYRCLRALGDSRSGSEYVNVIVRRDVQCDAADEIFRFLAEHAGLWDTLWLPNMGPEEDASSMIQSAAGHRGMRCRSREVRFARIRFDGTFEDYLKSLPRKIRYQMRRGLERLEHDRGAVLETCELEDQLDDALADLFRLHQARWTNRREKGIFSNTTTREHYKALCLGMLRRGWLRLDRAMIDEKAVAAQIGFAFNGVFHELQRGFDPDFPNIPAGLGSAVRLMVIRRSFTEGIKYYDFLGAFTEDKNRAGAKNLCGYDLLVVRPSPRNNLLFRSTSWPTGRYLRFPRAER